MVSTEGVPAPASLVPQTRGSLPALSLSDEDELTATRKELATRGVDTAEIQPVNKGVELSATSDPDGNTITLIGSFRVTY